MMFTMLAASPSGCMQSIMMAHGCAIGMLRDLARDGLAKMEPRRTIIARRAVRVTWLTITDAGRAALAD